MHNLTVVARTLWYWMTFSVYRAVSFDGVSQGSGADELVSSAQILDSISLTVLELGGKRLHY